MKKRKTTTKVIAGRKVETNPKFKTDERDIRRIVKKAYYRWLYTEDSYSTIAYDAVAEALAIGRARATKSNFKKAK